MLILVDNPLEHLILKAESTANWRRRKAVEFPDDVRNLRAAEELDRLAISLCELPAESLFRRFYVGLDLTEDAAEVLIACEDVMLRSVGFSGKFEDAEHLLGAIITTSKV